MQSKSTLIVNILLVIAFIGVVAAIGFRSIKMSAIQGCYEVAKYTNETRGQGATATDIWTVQDLKMNSDVLKDCLSKKGI